MGEFFKSYNESYIIIYCFLILWLNIDYLRDHKNIKKGFEDISSEDELDVNPSSFSLMFISLLFNFFRRWLIYLLAIFISENIFVIIISIALFLASLYDTLFNYSLIKVKKSNLGYYLVIIDMIFITSFIIYLFL